MNDISTENGWTDPDDAPKLDADWFASADLRDGNHLVRRGRPPVDHAKRAVSLRLDPDVIDWYRNSGPGWQTRMNAALRKAAGL